jgi:aldehyde:ferredoxin oxidoreductase
MYGYSGKILRVNLTEKKIIEEPITRVFARSYVGGQGFGAKIL